MGPGSKDQAGEDLWELTVDDLLSSPTAAAREPEPSAPEPYVVDLSVGIEPFCVLGPSLADFDHLHVYQVTDWLDDRLVFRLRLGPVESELEADMILTVVRRDYPNASSLLATDDDFRMIAIVAASAKPCDSKPDKARPAAATLAPAAVPATEALAEAPADLELAFREIAAELLALEEPVPPRREPPAPPPAAVQPPTLTAAIAGKPTPSASPASHADARVQCAPQPEAASAVPVLQLELVARPPRDRAEPRAAAPEPQQPAVSAPKAQTSPAAREAPPAKRATTAAASAADAVPKRPAPEPALVAVKRPPPAPAPVASSASPAMAAPAAAQPPRVALRSAPPETGAAVRDADAVTTAAPPSKTSNPPAPIAAEAPKPRDAPAPAAAPVPPAARTSAQAVAPAATRAPAAAPRHVAAAVPPPTDPAPAVPAPAATTTPAAVAAGAAPRGARPLAPVTPAVRSAVSAAKTAAPVVHAAAPAKTPPARPGAAATPAPRAPSTPAAAARETAPAKAAAKTAPVAVAADVLPGPPPAIDSTQTLRALVMPEADDGETDMLLVIQLATSDCEFAPDSVPNLAIFNEYRLYTAVGYQQGRVMYALRLGFFSDRAPAEAVAGYLRSFFEEPTVTRISTEERERFGKRRVKARKESGETGVYASIELSSAPAAPSTSLADLSARTRVGATAASGNEARSRSPTRG